MEEKIIKNKDVTNNENKGSGKKFRLIFSDWLLIILIAGLLIFLSTAVVTKQDEYTLILQFRKIVRVIDKPGLNFRIPFIQTIEKREQKILFYDLPRSDVITSDKKTMIVDSYVLWRITKPVLYYQTLSGLKVNAEGRIDTVVYNAIKNTISSMTQEEVILSRDGNVYVTQIDVEVEAVSLDGEEVVIQTSDIEIKSLTEEIAANLIPISDYGIEIITVEVKALDLPDSNKEAVYNRMISEREKVRTMYKSEGEAEAQMIRNQADKDVSVMLSQAKADAAKIIAEGE
ncbi:MAG: protease modulator HflC, partial [Lachnospiraceae bacterium]|nr:protease modulator HflC [Lachnospiraceae bacterium]